MSITEKASYLKGLAEGLAPDTAKPEGKLIDKLIELVSEMAEKIADLEEAIATLEDYADEQDSDLGDVEEYLYGDDDCDCDCDCDDEDDYEDDEADFYEAECPSCGETVCFDDSIDPSDVTCPACGEKFDCTCDGEDCEGCCGCEEK